MNDNEINVVIAEACGFRSVPQTPWMKETGKQFFVSPTGETQLGCDDYCTDLNAMACAEQWLQSDVGVITYSHNAFTAYKQYLLQVVGGPCATARQRAEAFLRTIGKWKE